MSWMLLQALFIVALVVVGAMISGGGDDPQFEKFICISKSRDVVQGQRVDFEIVLTANATKDVTIRMSYMPALVNMLPSHVIIKKGQKSETFGVTVPGDFKSKVLKIEASIGKQIRQIQLNVSAHK